MPLTYPPLTHQIGGNTSGATADIRTGTYLLAGGNNITLSQNGNSVTVSAAAGGVPIATAVKDEVSTVASTGTITRYAPEDHMHRGINSFGVSGGNTSNSSGLRYGRVALAGGNNITLSVATDGSGQSITISAPNLGAGAMSAGVSNIGNTSGATGVTGTRLVLAGGNNITLSQATDANGGTVTISGGAGLSAGASTGGNTAGDTGLVTGRLVFVGTGPVSLSGATNAGSATLSIDAPATSSIVGVNGISLSTNGSTISVLPQWNSWYENMNNGIVGSSAMTWNGASVSHAVQFMLPYPMSASFIRVPALMTTNSTTLATQASATASAQFAIMSSINAAIYSLGVGANSQSLQYVASGQATASFSGRVSLTNSTQYSVSLGVTVPALGGATNLTTQYSVSNTNISLTTNQIATRFSSGRFLDIPFTSSLSPGVYWMIMGLSTSSSSAGAAYIASVMSNVNVRYSAHYGGSQLNVPLGIMGSTNLTSGPMLGAGSFSTAGGGTTNSLPISALSSIASQARMYFQMHRSA